MSKTVAVGLSGGVDSTLTALLLKEQGYRVIGLTMSIYNKDIPNMKGDGNACYGPEEKQDFKLVQKWGAEHDIPVHILDCSEEYKQVVLSYFKEAYLSGATPNPCIKCNALMKFGLLVDKARQNGIKFDCFATGHFARISTKNNRFVLQKGIDEKKDQSYFLYRLTQEQLSQTLFPLGEYTKEQVREMARARHLAVAEKADSQDFYAGDYADLLEKQPQTGDIVHVNGRVLGKHNGFWNYTIGQRKGLGISYPVPLFVIDVDAAHNRVIVGEAEATYTSTCEANQVVWGGLSSLEEGEKRSVLIKYRSTGKCVSGSLSVLNNELQICFDEPQRAVTRGQSIVCYDKDDEISVLCGGILK